MRSIFGIVGFLGIVLTGALYGSPLWIFFDTPSIIFVLGTMVTLSVSKYSFKELSTFSDEVVMSLINFSLIGGGVGFFVGLVQMLQNMSDPSLIGPAMAVAILTVLYSLIISACLYAFKRGIKTRRIGIAAVAGSLAAFVPLFILILSFAKP